MDKQDLILLHLFAKVRGYREPEDHPVSSAQVALENHLSVEQTLDLCYDLAQEGFVAISPLSIPPLVYLTLTGLARVRRLEADLGFLSHKSAS
ncbi:hypothetical protein [Rufibacter hautae]|uniref:MarR family transcriptional regulator n=1 Tax=Rufibacter hautae TaxID=2595005 RepID=A0A5B6T7X1_9BACT|nr:hypothetical protein [Rufibacter hautae]KAA3436276.1 hypothetical protein FOA19_17920 [Rufibacter hautae]